MTKILLVEDDYLLSEMYGTKLRLEGFEVAVAHNSQEAFDIMDEQEIDLVLLDMVLPRSNGVAILHEFKSYSDWRRVPIIILSNMTHKDVRLSQDLLQNFGVKKYLVKSKVKPAQVAQAVKEVLSESGSNIQN